MSPRATTPPPATPFSTKKRNSAGGESQKAKGATGGARPALLDRRRGSELGFCAKMGSSEFKKSLQNGFFRDWVALTGGFFGGGA